ncbi:MAG: sensor histidine kinase [Christensenellales bacterium]
MLDNAVKFTSEGKRVSLALEGKTIVIADEGIGIPAEELAHIFDRFRRTRRSNEQGTGLGLAICSEVARRHGIAIDVASRVGEGTTFRFTFPDGGS